MSTWQQQQKGKMREYCFLKFVGILLPENVGILLPEKNCGNTVSQKLTTIVVRYNSLMNVSKTEGALEAVGVWAPPFFYVFSVGVSPLIQKAVQREENLKFKSPKIVWEPIFL
jgi:hypothetical protein